MFGQSYFNGVVGEFVWFGDSRSMAMGQTGITESHGFSNLWINPALLNIDGRFLFESTLQVKRLEEQRTFPVIDMFEDIVTDNIYNVSSKWFQNESFGAVLNLPLLPFTLAIGKAPFLDFRFQYDEGVRGNLTSSNYNRDPLVGYHRISSDGKIDAVSGGIALRLLDRIHFGVSGHILTASEFSRNYSVIVIESDDALAAEDTLIFESKWDIEKVKMKPSLAKPYTFSAGGSIDFNWHISISANYRHGVHFKTSDLSVAPSIDENTLLPAYTWREDSLKIQYAYPEKYSLGIRYQPTNPIPTKLFAEIHYTDWSQFKISYSRRVNDEDSFPHNFRETYEFRFGLEHMVLRKIPFRAGFIYAESPYGNELDRSIFTIGSGFSPLDNLTVDVAGKFTTSAYKYVDIFPPVGQESTGLENVKESIGTLSVTMKYEF